jgi:hypothetical protein
MTTTELSPYLALILVGFLPNEIWRVLGLLLARGLSEDSEIVVWSRAMATAILAGVIAKLILFPGGALATIPLRARGRCRVRLRGPCRRTAFSIRRRTGQRGRTAAWRLFICGLVIPPG